jgi:AcrR family transcriptional regulator
MIQSALVLMGENGVEATSFSQVIEHSGAPRGSIYHHFPGGKAQLVEEAVRYAGGFITNLLAARMDNEDPVAAVDATIDFWLKALQRSNYSVGCPVLAATLESNELPGARAAAREAFERFQSSYSRLLEQAGVPAERASSLAAIAVAATEGGIILARAQHSDAPLERVVAELRVLFHAAIRDVRSEDKALA